MTRAFLGLGSNVGDRLGFLRGAVESLGTSVVGVSPVYETDPVGGPVDQGPYLNIVVELRTDLAPRELLAVAQRLESGAGRVRDVRWGPRTLDVDVLAVGELRVDTPDLVVPHPRIADRAFVLVPLADLDPECADRFDPGGIRRTGADRASVRPTGLRLSAPE
jgi:2-amino-4-hydroxy-6-hydroxymethyldihydropteridine diphosphokinase